MSQTSVTCMCFLMLMVHVRLQAPSFSENDEVSNTNQNVLEQCGHRLTNSSGSIILSASSLSTSASLVCVIHVQNASSLHVMFRHEWAQFNVTNGNGSNLLHITIYDQDPEQAGFPLEEWDSQENNFVMVVTGNELWLDITYNEDHVISSTGDFNWSVAYAAQIGQNVPACNISKIERPENGIAIVNNYTFGSVVNLACSEGYVLQDGLEYAVCSVVAGALSWLRAGASCSSTCNHPPPVKNAKTHIRTTYFISNNSSGFAGDPEAVMNTSANGANTTVSYVCDEPYILNGIGVIDCGFDHMGIPRWSNYPPSCIISDCSWPISFTQHSGVMVNPSYPAHHLKGGSVMCEWDITGPDGSIIYINVTYVDFPTVPSVVLILFDRVPVTPNTMRSLFNQSGPVSWYSGSSKASVMYRGPQTDVSGYRGFYARYFIRSRDTKERKLGDINSTVTTEASPTGQPELSFPPTSTDGLTESATTIDGLTETATTIDGLTESATTIDGLTETATTIDGHTETATTIDGLTETATTITDIQGLTIDNRTYSSNLDITGEFTAQPAHMSTENGTENIETFTTPTNQVTPSAYQSTEGSMVLSAQTSTEQTAQTSTEQTAETSIEQSTEIYTAAPENETTPILNASEDSSDDWKIAVGVVVPLMFLIIVLVAVYIFYRKKYPVRMIIGREFAKFSNPNYKRRGHLPSLVREDADFYFSNRTSSDVPSQDLNPVHAKIMYDNKGFVRDEGDDEEEKERKFLQSKSWLFKKTSDEPDTAIEKMAEINAESSFTVGYSSEEMQYDLTGVERKASTGTHTSEIVPDHLPQPKPKPRQKKKASAAARAGEAKTSLNDQLNGQPSLAFTNSGFNAAVTETLGSSLPRTFTLTDKGGASSLMKRNMKLFHQPSFDQVWAEVKERSKSLTGELTPSSTRQRSYSVDPSKSARKMSLHDERIISSNSQSLAASGMSQLPSNGTHTVTAFIVGVDIRDGDTSITSSVLNDEGDNSVQTTRAHNIFGLNKWSADEDGATSLENNLANMKDHSQTLAGDYADISKNYDVISSLREWDEQDVAFASASSIKNTTDERSKDSALLDKTFVGTNVETKNSNILLPSRSESSGSDSDHERTNTSLPSVSSASKLQIHVANNSSSNTREAKSNSPVRNTIKILKLADRNMQPELGEEIITDHREDTTDGTAEPTLTDIIQFDRKSRDRKSSSSSTESVIASSESLRSVSSETEEEGISYDVSSKLELYRKHDQRKDQESDSGSDELAMDSSTPPISATSPVSLLSDFTKQLPTYESSVDPDHVRKVLLDLQFSDSSSDSSDIVPRKDVLLLSRQPENLAQFSLSEENPALIKTNTRKEHGNLSNSKKVDVSDDREGDIAQTMLASSKETVFRLRDDGSGDDDIDV